MLATRTQIMLLTWTAASFDAISYVALGEVFTANMTGNTVLLGLSAARGDVAAILRSCTAVGGFCLGALLGSVMVGDGEASGVRPRRVTAALIVETFVFFAFASAWLMVGHHAPESLIHLLIVVAGGAMGLQSAIVLHLRISGISTTYITGTLTHLMMLVASRLLGSGGEKSADRLGQLSGVWVVYLVSAVFTGVTVKYFHAQAVFIPALVILLVLLDRLRRA